MCSEIVVGVRVEGQRRRQERLRIQMKVPARLRHLQEPHLIVWRYDANGNLTSDGLHTYAWDAEGNLSQLDGGTAMVYDAFGRRVEQTNSSGTAEILYGPDESKLAWGSYEDTADSLADRRRHRADSLDADGRCRRAVPEAV